MSSFIPSSKESSRPISSSRDMLKRNASMSASSSTSATVHPGLEPAFAASPAPRPVSSSRDMLKLHASRSASASATGEATMLASAPAAAPAPRPVSSSRDMLKLHASRSGSTSDAPAPRPVSNSAAREMLKSNASKEGTASKDPHPSRRGLSAIPESSGASDASSESLSLLDDISAAFGGASLSNSRPQSNSANKTATKLYTAKICFLMDITGSMDPQKDAVKEKIVDIVDASLAAFPQVALQIAFVGYRDVDCSASQRVEIVQFTTDIDLFYTSLLDVTCHGGGDEAEDVLGGMEAALTQLDWSGARIKVIFHIGDSPHHGSIFHDVSCGGCQDEHAELHNVPRPYSAILSDYADHHIDYNFALVRNPRGKVTTREMGRLFASAYNACQSKKSELAVVDLTDFSPDHLLDKVLKGLSSSICSFLAAASRKR